MELSLQWQTHTVDDCETECHLRNIIRRTDTLGPRRRQWNIRTAIWFVKHTTSKYFTTVPWHACASRLRQPDARGRLQPQQRLCRQLRMSSSLTSADEVLTSLAVQTWRLEKTATHCAADTGRWSNCRTSIYEAHSGCRHCPGRRRGRGRALTALRYHCRPERLWWVGDAASRWYCTIWTTVQLEFVAALISSDVVNAGRYTRPLMALLNCPWHKCAGGTLDVQSLFEGSLRLGSRTDYRADSWCILLKTQLTDDRRVASCTCCKRSVKYDWK